MDKHHRSLSSRSLEYFFIFAACAVLLLSHAAAAQSSKPVVICILDSGCNLPGAAGRSFTGAADDLSDATGHGTAIYALTHELAPEADIYMLKCFEAVYTADDQAILRALRAAANEYQADIISVSWTVGTASDELKGAVRHAVGQGAVILAAAGNLSLQTGIGSACYPAALDEVIGVGGVNINKYGQATGSLWYLTGSAVFVCAEAGYEGERGSSFAVPRVAAFVAACLKEAPGASADDIRLALRSAAQDLGEPGYDSQFGWGYIKVP